MTYFGISGSDGTSVEVATTWIPGWWQMKVRAVSDDGIGILTTFDHFWGTKNYATEVVADQWNDLLDGWPYEDGEDE